MNPTQCDIRPMIRRRSTPIPVCLVSCLFLFSFSALPLAQPISNKPLKPYVIRLALIALEPPTPQESKQFVAPILGFLEQARLELERSTDRPVEFEVVLGSYYQVWSWFRARQIDAAIVSPFMAYLLEHDGSAMSVLELPETGSEQGYVPKIAASQGGQENPTEAFERYLGQLLDEANHKEPGPLKLRLNFVTHLSPSGFVIPTLYAFHWLARPERNSPDEATKQRFWEMFFERSRFTQSVQHPTEGTTDIYFSYSGRLPAKLDYDINKGDMGTWQTLGEGSKTEWKPPVIPPDVVIVRRRLAQEVLKTTDPDALAERLVKAGERVSFRGESLYTAVRRLNPGIQKAFRQQAESIFGENPPDKALAALRLHQRWFELGRFDFTIDETLGFLRLDQKNSGISRLALVLSGGGVKSLYQAKLLDRLYGLDEKGSQLLRNFDEEPYGPKGAPDPGESGPMTVHTTIGTSGGAMLAFFAALVPRVKSLTDIAETAAAKQLFPTVDIPRATSTIFLAFLFVLSLHISKMFRWLRKGPYPESNWSVPQARRILLLAPILLIAMVVCVRVLRVPHAESVQYLRAAEGALFALSAVVIHMAMVCIAQGTEAGVTGPTSRAADGVLGMWLGTAIVGTAGLLKVLGTFDDYPSPLLVFLPLLATAGVGVVAASLLRAASGGWSGLRLLHAREYVSAVAVMVVVIASSYAGVVGAARAGTGTLLELTSLFWLWVLAAGAFVSLLVLWIVRWLAARTGHPVWGYLRQGIDTLIRDRVGGLTLTVGAAMTAFFTVALGLWIVVVAPAVYGSERAYEALKGSVGDDTLRSGTFRTNLIVTGALLADTPCRGGKFFARGPLYSCFEGPGSCIATSDRWHTFTRPIPQDALEAVFASGSPFPIFPAHEVSLPDGCDVALVDGGYAHNIPLEAAVEAEARQVLVLNATPDSEEPSTGWRAWLGRVARPSELMRGAPRMFEFMFSQAQELDRSMARRLMVASLGPRPNRDWPWLLDFRERTRRLVIKQAKKDIIDNRRIGHIQEWGTPTVYATVGTAGVQTASAVATHDPVQAGRWIPSVRQHLTKLLREGHGAAAFDLDNTCLRGDIGQAMFLKLIAELRYQGDRDDFWTLIQDETARERLRAYWREFHAYRPDGGQDSKPPRYFDPSTWPNEEFTDYVALFWKQYQSLLAASDEGRSASAWVVRLMAGMKEQDAITLARDVWASEMRRGLKPQIIKSKTNGEFSIDGGVRVHGEIADAIAALRDAGLDVWLVTSSNQYIAEEAAKHLGISIGRGENGRVLGIRSRVKGDALQSELEGLLTYRDALAKHVKPRIAFGDSMAEYDILKAATVAVVVDRDRIRSSAMLRPTKWLLQPASVLTPRVVY